MSHPGYTRLVKALKLEQPDDMVPWYGGLLSNAHHITGRPVITNADFIQPCLNEHVNCLKNTGAWIVFHSDGNLAPVLDPIISSGMHGLNPIDPMAGMDIAEVKRRYGKRVALFGNVQCDLVHRGPLAAIRERARYCLESAKMGGGLVLVTSAEVFADTPWENYLEVKNARECWGRYNGQ